MRARNDGLIAGLGIVLVAVAGASAAWIGWAIAATLNDDTEPVPGNPALLVRELIRRRVEWPSTATPWAIAAGTVVFVLLLTLVVLFGRRHRHRSSSVDAAAKLMPRDRGIRRYIGATGPPIGRLITGHPGRGSTISMTDEDQGLVIAGPRTGKTTRLAIPAALAHDGPVVITSNKRDIFDAVAEPRSRRGRVWLFDPQDLAGSGAARWWWDPLALAHGVRGARRLASIWTTAARDPQARTDAYFDGAAQELLAQLLCAAAHAGVGPLGVYQWLSRPDDPSAVDVLRQSADTAQLAAGLESNARLPDKQRAGVYGTAQQLVAWIADPAIRSWIEPGAGRPQYDPASLATSHDTLVSLSREGEGSAAPLVTALTAAVLDAAEQHAAQSPRGRLSPVLLGVLDEAANVCRWRELPDLYSHYGSRGIVLCSYAQSWAQIAEAFGEHGAEKLWSSSNVRVYGGGVSDTSFLRRLSELVGEHDETVWSSSTSVSATGPRSRSDSAQQRRRSIMEIATLAAMPAGRALVLLSAARPVLVELIPYQELSRSRSRR